jgi:hypothetical protein
MPTARDQAAEDRTPRGLFVKVKRLRIEFLRKGDNVVFVDANPPIGA